MKYFRIKTGHGKDDFISVDETELDMAIRAQITGKVGLFKEGTVTGRAILTITPDWQKTMGWNRDYSLTGEDYNEIGEKKIDGYRDFIAERKIEVDKQLGAGSKNLLE